MINFNARDIAVLRETVLLSKDNGGGTGTYFSDNLIQLLVIDRAREFRWNEVHIHRDHSLEYWGRPEHSRMIIEEVAKILSESEVIVVDLPAATILMDKTHTIIGTLEVRFTCDQYRIRVTVDVELFNTVFALIQTIQQPSPPRFIGQLKLGGGGRDPHVYMQKVIPHLNEPHPDIMVNYPYLELSPAELWKSFAESKENVMLFIGPPGTGKSTFASMMLDERGYDRDTPIALYVSNDELLDQPALVNYLETVPRGTVVVMEDSDRFTQKRTNGNRIMSSILGIADGIVDYGVKFVVLTNLESLSDVDPALIRPGRGHAVIRFRNLNITEVNAARAALDKEPITDPAMQDKEVSLSVALNYRHDSLSRTTKFGFNT